MRHKGVLTTGQVAQVCQVAPRTVSKWFDSGQLKGYRVPGSKDRRIPVDELVRFMRAHGLPLETLETGATRLLVVEATGQLGATLRDTLKRDARLELATAESAFAAGVAAARFKPHVILVDVLDPGLRQARWPLVVGSQQDCVGVKILAVARDAAEGETLRAEGFHAFLERPIDRRQLLDALDRLLEAPDVA